MKIVVKTVLHLNIFTYAVIHYGNQFYRYLPIKMSHTVVFQCYCTLKKFQNLVLPKIVFKNQNEIFKKFFHNSCVRKEVKAQPQATQSIFDRKAKKLQRERAALLERPEVHDQLKEEVGYRLADRIFDIKKKFSKAIDLGCGRGFVSRHITGDSVEELIMTDHSELLMSQCVCDDPSVKTKKIVCDEEHLLEVFEPESIDLVISNLVLHWVNELPSCFKQVIEILKMDGVFLACMFGLDTLFELRSSLQLAELERKGGISPHISPFVRPTDVGNLLLGAGFVMQTIDIDEIIVRYPSMFELMEDLKGMGESNASWNRTVHLSRDVLLAASVIYEQLYAHTKKSEENDAGVPATFQIIYFIAWKPDPSKPQPEQKNPTMVSLKDFYNIDEITSDSPKKIKLD